MPLAVAALPADLTDHLRRCATFFDHHAAQVSQWQRRNAGYHHAVASYARCYVPAATRVLEVGTGTGDLLAALEPADGLGIDISAEMIRLAAARHPAQRFRRMAVEELDVNGETFDYIVLSDLVGYLYDIQRAFERLRVACQPSTRLVLNWHSRLWQPILAAAQSLGWKYPQPVINWTTPEDIRGMLHLAGFEVVQFRRHILLPKQVPAFTALANRVLAHLPGFQSLCLTNWLVARPLGLRRSTTAPRVSVICPCRNEAGTIAQIVDRLPALGRHTELIFVEGHSTDDTAAECRRLAAAHPDKDIKVFTQEGHGKGDAVRLGFAKATGDIVAILDADLSVAPEDLTQFFDVLVRDQAEFVNGSRFVYAMDPEAMRFLNLVGNRSFALLLSQILGQPVKDTLCGTKALWRVDYERIARQRSLRGDLDPFGDFDLLLGAATLNLKIAEVPVRYRRRIYGTTNISRFAHGWLLLRMTIAAARRMLFI